MVIGSDYLLLVLQVSLPASRAPSGAGPSMTRGLPHPGLPLSQPLWTAAAAEMRGGDPAAGPAGGVAG